MQKKEDHFCREAVVKGIHESRSSSSLSSIKQYQIFWSLMGELTLTSKSSNWRYAVVVMMMSTCTCKKPPPFSHIHK